MTKWPIVNHLQTMIDNMRQEYQYIDRPLKFPRKQETSMTEIPFSFTKTIETDLLDNPTPHCSKPIEKLHL